MKARYAFFGAAILAAALAACGGGGGGSVPPTNTTPTPSPTPTLPPHPGQVTFGALPTSAPIPSGAGITGSVALPAGSGTGTFTFSNSPPANGPVAVQSRRQDATTGNSAVVYATLTANGSLTLHGIPGFTAKLPAGSPAGTYYVAYYADASASPHPQAAAWVSTTTAGPTGSSGSQIAIPATTSPAITLASGKALYLAVYVGGYIPPININGCVGVQSMRSNIRTTMAAGVHPIGANDAYNYSGTLQQTLDRTQPCPQPTDASKANVAVAVAIATPSSTTTENSTETDTYPTYTSTVTTVATVTAAPSGSYYEIGEQSTDGNGNTTATTFTSPVQYAQLPDAAGNHWSDAPPSSVTQTLADGTVIARHYNPQSGVFYKETQTLPGGYGANVVTVNTNGSGTYDIGQGTTNETLASLSAPTGLTITITIGQQSLKVPSWFPSSFAQNGLYSDATADLGPVTSLPSGCTSPVSNPPAIEHIQRSISTIDPVLGFVENETVDSYDINAVSAGSNGWFGPVCVKISDALDQYYDWSFTNAYGLYFTLNAQPVLTNTIAETLSLNSGFTAFARTRNNSAKLSAQITAREAGIRFIRSMQRSQTIRQAINALRAGGTL